jgi:hypothetical protein
MLIGIIDAVRSPIGLLFPPQLTYRIRPERLRDDAVRPC